MQIGINCLQIDPAYAGGVNTYTLGLLEGFTATRNGCRIQLYVTEANSHLFEKFRENGHFAMTVIDERRLALRKNICRAALLSGSRKFYKFANDLSFENVRKLMDSGTDIVYTPTVVLQCFNGRKPTVLSMHDIQHVHYPEFFSRARRLSRKITYGLSAHHASYFQASSHFIKEDLLAHFGGISPDQIEVIPEGVRIEEFAAPRPVEPLIVRYGLAERFLFFPAQLWPHKNHMTVLKALKRIETTQRLKIPLVMTGAKFSAAPQIFKFIAEQSMEYVSYLGKVPFGDVVALYQQAAFLVTAVLYESSSLPILEAAAAGTPIIASKTPPNEEIARVLRLNLFDPLDTDELARLILALWNDEKTASAQTAYNREHIGFYSWENAARKYLQFFQRIVNS
jgi:glycosyltransferase involved in cell wall biosynthesis